VQKVWKIKYNWWEVLEEVHPETNTTLILASFPGLHTQLLSLAVRKAGEGLDGFIT